MKIKTTRDLDIHPISIPEWIKTQLSPDEHISVSQGKKSSIKEFLTPEGEKFVGRLQLSDTEHGTSIRFYDKNTGKLEIPKKIEDKELTPANIKDLESNKFIQLPSGNYLKIDRQLNKLLIYSPKELGEIKTIGNYTMTPKDKLQLLNGESLTRVFKNDKNGHYIVSTFSIDKNNALVFDLDHTKIIEPKEYAQYNIDKLEKSFNTKGLDHEQVMKDFLEGNDKASQQLKVLMNEGFSPSLESINKLTNNLSHDRTHALLAIFNQDSKGFDRFQQAMSTKELHDGFSANKFKISSYDLTKNSLILEGSKGERIETIFTKGLQTTEERQTYLQSMSRSLSPSKAMGLGK